MKMEGTSVLFYSPKCPFCVECLSLLEPFANKIKFLGYINIHKARGLLPENVTKVPTLILKNKGNENDVVFYEGKQVYIWIVGLINTLQHETTHGGGKSTSAAWSESEASPLDYVSIDHHKTITESIDYSKIKTVEKEHEKVAISPDVLQEQRNSDLQRFLPPANAFF